MKQAWYSLKELTWNSWIHNRNCWINN